MFRRELEFTTVYALRNKTDISVNVCALQALLWLCQKELRDFIFKTEVNVNSGYLYT